MKITIHNHVAGTETIIETDAVTPLAAPQPKVVTIKGIDPTKLYSGKDLLDALKEIGIDNDE